MVTVNKKTKYDDIKHPAGEKIRALQADDQHRQNGYGDGDGLGNFFAKEPVDEIAEKAQEDDKVDDAKIVQDLNVAYVTGEFVVGLGLIYIDGMLFRGLANPKDFLRVEIT